LIKPLLHIILLLVPFVSTGQYYITGSIADNNGKPIPMVKMRLKSNGQLLQNGNMGDFGIPSYKKTDTVTCFLLGYDTVVAAIKAGVKNSIIMQPTPYTKNEQNARLASLTSNLNKDATYIKHLFDETYSSTIENSFVNATQYPSTGISLNVNKASYSNLRRFLNNSTEVPQDAVRIEEMLNYFSLNNIAMPVAPALFNVDTKLSNCPWEPNNMLMYINVQAKKIDLDKVPPSNLVFLIDNSGSMDMPNRLPLLKAGFSMLVNNLRATDTVSLVSYGGAAGVMLQPTSGANKQVILKAIEDLTPQGATPGSAGLKMAYEIARSKFIKNGNNRVILATDGDFNVGAINEKELENLIINYKNSGIYLTCLGVGMGNYKDSKLEVLARFGNGNFSYIDSEKEAEKVLVKEFTQTLVSLASNVFIHMDFDPAYIAQYRLIGFDNKYESITDKNSVLDGGEIGSGQSMMALVEIVPTPKLDTSNTTILLGQIKLQYQQPQQQTPQIIKHTIPQNYTSFLALPPQLRLGASVAMFGQLLKQSKYAANYNFDAVANIATQAAAPGDLLQQEFVKLIAQAKKIYVYADAKKKKLKKKK
jgi:Ca-activated chloride channel homolog